MKLLNKDSRTKKAQDYLKSSSNVECYITEDGSIFLEGSMQHAMNRAAEMKKKFQGNGDVLTVKASKAAPKSAPKAEEKVEVKAPAKPKKSKKK